MTSPLRSRGLCLLTAAALPLLALTACGGGGGGDALSKADYVAASEKICSSTNKAIDDLPQPSAPAEVKPALNTVVSAASKAVEQLEALGDKQPDKAELHKIFLDPLRAQIVSLSGYVAKVPDQVNSEADLPEQPDPPTPAADTDAMKAYGFDACITATSTE